MKYGLVIIHIKEDISEIITNFIDIPVMCILSNKSATEKNNVQNVKQKQYTICESSLTYIDIQKICINSNVDRTKVEDFMYLLNMKIILITDMENEMNMAYRENITCCAFGSTLQPHLIPHSYYLQDFQSLAHFLHLLKS